MKNEEKLYENFGVRKTGEKAESFGMKKEQLRVTENSCDG
jgi:hypothetical protein